MNVLANLAFKQKIAKSECKQVESLGDKNHLCFTYLVTNSLSNVSCLYLDIKMLVCWQTCLNS